jgi:hypothetical protein
MLHCSIPGEARDFSILLRVQTSSAIHRNSHSMYAPLGGQRGLFPRDERDQGVKLTTRHHRVPKPRISEAKPPLPNTISRRAQGQIYFNTSARLTEVRIARIL